MARLSTHKKETILEANETGKFWDNWKQLEVDGMDMWEVANGCEKKAH